MEKEIVKKITLKPIKCIRQSANNPYMRGLVMKIGTHNSATGERPQGLISWLGTPFARCQTKTIREQYDAGCRFYDLRVRTYGNDWL